MNTVPFLMMLATGAASAFLLALAVNEFCAWRGIPRRRGFSTRRSDDDE